MRPAALVVHEVSVPYVRNVLAALHATLRETLDPDARMLACASVDEAPVEPGSVVLIVGENLGRFRRRPGCTYAFVNFSVVRLLGNPFAVSLDGLRLIRRKARLLREKLDLIDAVIDYYPAQTRGLAARLPRPVFGFVPWVDPSETEALEPEERPFDLCFVGGLSPRRQAVLERLKSAGLRLSPAAGIDLETAASRSRVTLNLHMQRSNHLEIPRVMGAMAAGSFVVTERSHGLGDLVPAGLVKSAPYRRVADAVLRALDDRQALERRARASGEWYRATCVPAAREAFAATLDRVAALRPA